MSTITAKLSPGVSVSGSPGCAANKSVVKRERLLGCTLLCGLSLLAQVAYISATTFSPLGGEYAILGSQLGAQEASSVALGAGHGAIVWQDDHADNDGLGIRMQWLNQSFSGSFSPFRVNETETGNQEHPKVAMLNDDGAVIVWQGGSEVDTDIYARFIAADGTFVTGEIRANTYTALLQIDPDVAVLNDGSVIVIWSSFNQDGSYQGVFGQRFTSAGAKIGSEFAINQYTANNQRNASVAALSNGGFVVTWVSERPSQVVTNPDLTPVDQGVWVQQVVNRIEIKARLYDAQGVAAGNEFQVDASNLVCATPSVTGRADGGFSIVWAQLNSDPANEWDVYARSFDSAGTASGAPFMVNQVMDGRQHTPKVVASGDQLFVLWTGASKTSYNDDVYARFVGLDAGGSLNEFMVNFTKYSIQNQPALAISRAGQALVVWTSFVGGQNSGDLRAQRYNSNQPLPVGPTPVVSGRDSNSIIVSWSDLVGLGVSTYSVYIDGIANPVQVAGNTTQTIVYGLQPGTEYVCRVSYTLSDNRVSGLSSPGSGRTWGVDSNSDGIPDDWQISYWGTSASKWGAPNDDSDGDGMTNYQEFLAGTDPRNAASSLKTEVQMVDGLLYFKWNTVSGKVYQIQYSTDFHTWVNVGSQRLAASGEDSVFVEQSSGIGFYRIVLVR